MKLKDIADMKEYLENRCYCPYEIYDLTGFFFNCFEPDVECELLAEGERGGIHGSFVLAKPSRFNEDSLQIIHISHRNGIVEDCVRFDATPNNREQVIQFLGGLIDKMTIDEYETTKTEENLKEVLSIADAVCY